MKEMSLSELTSKVTSIEESVEKVNLTIEDLTQMMNEFKEEQESKFERMEDRLDTVENSIEELMNIAREIENDNMIKEEELNSLQLTKIKEPTDEDDSLFEVTETNKDGLEINFDNDSSKEENSEGSYDYEQ